MPGAPYPGFPVKFRGFGQLHAAFLNESRTRGRLLGPRTGNQGICPVLADVGFHRAGPGGFLYCNRSPAP
jgi:hypothetical protein